MTATLVSTVAALVGAAYAAHGPGDVVQLAPGDYVMPAFVNVHPKDVLTITSADPAHPAVIHGWKIGNSSNLDFEGLELTTVGATDPWYAFRIGGSSNITVGHSFVHGDLSKPTPVGEGNALFIQGSSNVTLTANRFQNLGAGVIANQDDGLVIERSEFSRMNKGAIEGGALTNARFQRNYFHDFWSTPGGHADVIQIYSSGLKTSSRNVLIDGNTFQRGSDTESTAPQDLFAQDEAGNLPMIDFTITNNVMLGGQWNGILVHHPAGKLTITGNVVRSWAGLNMDNKTQMSWGSWIRVAGDTTAAEIVMTGNAAQAYMDTAGHAMTPPPGNVIIK